MVQMGMRVRTVAVKNLAFNRVVVGVLLTAGFCAVAFSQDRPSPEDLLERVERSANVALPPLSINSTTRTESRFRNSQRQSFKSQVNEDLLTDNRRNELRQWSARVADDGVLTSQHGFIKYNLQDPPRYVKVDQSSDGSVRSAEFSENSYMPNLAKEQSVSLRLGNAAFGDELPVTQILKGYTNLSVGDTLENVDGNPCYVLEGSGENGEYKLWIDPANGFGTRRLQVHKSGSNLMFGKPMNANPDQPDDPKMAYPMTMTEDLLFEMTDVEFEKVADGFLISRAKIVLSERHSGGEIVEITRDYVANNISVNPDFDALNAFVPPIPRNMPIKNLDFPGLPFKWVDGNIVGGVEAGLIQQLEQTLQSEPAPEAAEEKATAPEPREDEQPTTAVNAAVFLGGAFALVFAGVLCAGWYMQRQRRLRRQ